jgi:hypothetical protein
VEKLERVGSRGWRVGTVRRWRVEDGKGGESGECGESGENGEGGEGRV